MKLPCKLLGPEWEWGPAPSKGVLRLYLNNASFAAVNLNREHYETYGYTSQGEALKKVWPLDTTQEEMMTWVETMIVTGAV